MKTSTNKTIPHQSRATFHPQKPLLPIKEYAARQGLSINIIEGCANLGIVQIRKFKGKTFVVDVPLSPYACPSEADEQQTQPLDKTAQTKKISELLQKLFPDDPIRPKISLNQPDSPK